MTDGDGAELAAASTARRIEALMWDHDELAAVAGLVHVQRSDRILWRGAADSPLASRVVRVGFSENDAEAGIDEILAFYREAGKSFTWWIGPNSGPASLERRLLDRGLTVMDTCDIVGLPLDAEISIAADPRVEVVPVEDEATVRELIALNGTVWGHGEADQRRQIADRLAYLQQPGRRGGAFIGRVAGVPAGTGAYRYSEDGRTVYLSGAATLPEFRGHGVFRTLLAHRLDLARTHGCELAGGIARVSTSAPIVKRLGFRAYGTIRVLASPQP